MSRFAVSAAFALATVGLAFSATTPARADAQVGVLSCHSAAAANYVVVSTQDFNCTFTPTAGAVQRYNASMHRVGAQIGFTNDAVLSWAVFAASSRVGPGALAGSYGGVSAGAAVGIGGNANGLAGGYNNAFTLQPLSLQGETGLNVVATITGLDLSSPPVRHHKRKRRH